MLQNSENLMTSVNIYVLFFHSIVLELTALRIFYDIDTIHRYLNSEAIIFNTSASLGFYLSILHNQH